MARTHSEDFERDDGTNVTVEFTCTGGCSAHYGSMSYAGHPEEPPEIEIVKAFNDAGDVRLTDAEDERMTMWLLENFTDDSDYDDYYDWEA